MKFFRIDLLTLLISLFILNSCKNQDTIGLDPGANGVLGGSLVDTASVYTNTVPEDSVATNSLTKNPLGYINDPIFGTTQSDMVTDLNLPGSTAYTRPTGNIVIDSALLILKYADGFYGDSLTNYTLNVYQLNERLNSGQTYYNTKKWNYNSGNILGTKTFQPRPVDSIFLDSVITGAKDSLVRSAPQVRIPISTNFVNDILFDAGATNLSSNLIFENSVKGLYITVDKSQTSGVGGLMMFKAPTTSALAIYVRATNGTVVDTTVVYLDVNQHATAIQHSYTTQVQNALSLSAQNAQNHTKISDSVMYLQGTAGLRARISFPFIDSLFSRKNVGNNSIIINRAELVVTAEPGSDIPSYLVPLPKLTLYRYDISHQRASVEDANSLSKVFTSVGQFGGFYTSTTRNYHFLVTSFIQDLVSGNTTDYGTFIGPVDLDSTATTVDIAATPQTAARTKAVGYSKSSPYRIKLNVIYTKTSK